MSEKAGYDVVVVGGGAAGCVVAARLAEDGTRRVLLLEAGPDHRALMPADVRDGWRPTTRHDWGYVSEPDAGGVARPLPRGKLLGGCSSTNATFALRGHPAATWRSCGHSLGRKLDNLGRVGGITHRTTKSCAQPRTHFTPAICGVKSLRAALKS